MPISGYSSAALPLDCLLDGGVLYVGSTPFAASRGGLKFDPGKVMRQIAFDGSVAAVKGLDRIVTYAPVISGKIIQFGASVLTSLEAGASTTFASATAVTGVITAKKGAVAFVAGDYISNFKLVYERANNGGYVEVIFPVALCRKYALTGTNNEEATVDCEFEARIDPTISGATVYDAPYTINGVATP